MATKIGLGVPMPLLAPATATWAAPFAAYYVFLQNRIVYHRLTTETFMGDSTDSTQGTKDPLYVATRAQLNFAENVPLALAIALLAELNGANRTYLNWALGTLFALRISHVELGLMRQNSMGPGRIIGYYGSQGVLVALAGYTAYLVKDFLQIAA
ncbi:membrane-associated, eicosanoid/glutathione metabolism protein [Boeremia exigua]|uniref:membrane-associated, eicosanoid/glutathione metabolism protein n=1 Tax=Boeremia exigua TaxID=749465 RepID=UPI001E8CC5F3|nr:membrane-associated, eicosanoid/glutathione metabolism protein [Boeremia exigua]KAH6637738.1 membrane-associated, eicosanoid/glutathione metabolism protein [Boeremia exigua]